MAFVGHAEDSWTFHGGATALDGDSGWSVRYEIEVGPDWVTRSADVAIVDASGRRQVRLDHDGAGHWRVDGEQRPELDGCLDVDLETSALTNAFPVLRGSPGDGARFAAPAAYVRATGTVTRLEQTYEAHPRTTDDARQFDYAAPEFAFTARIAYDPSGLVLDYPGIARRLR
ncbi:hypothetical protein BCF74_12343 [Knoellia remsis]|uniref:Glycolipid-binding protein n=1 Tax=Knoellia remsis TaxID=407159 RepID=A0A2T0UAD2_9MICO|nr:hypothetical protein BCF74_12343 [Knoellia remsis]